MKKSKKTIQKLETNFMVGVPAIAIERCWGKREYNKFCKWMYGQTAFEGGFHLCDVEDYARQRNKGIKNIKDILVHGGV